MASFIQLFKDFSGWILNQLPTDLTEILLFSITVGLIIIIASLIHYTRINSRVQSESRCYRDKNESNLSEGVYKITAYDPNGTEIYDVTYDIGAKQYTIQQKCKEGTVQNKISIRVYDLGRKQIDRIDRIFECDKDYNLRTTNLYYRGDPGLVRFMEYSNTEFFEKVMGGYQSNVGNTSIY